MSSYSSGTHRSIYPDCERAALTGVQRIALSSFPCICNHCCYTSPSKRYSAISSIKALAASNGSQGRECEDQNRAARRRFIHCHRLLCGSRESARPEDDHRHRVRIHSDKDSELHHHSDRQPWPKRAALVRNLPILSQCDRRADSLAYRHAASRRLLHNAWCAKHLRHHTTRFHRVQRASGKRRKLVLLWSGRLAA